MDASLFYQDPNKEAIVLKLVSAAEVIKLTPDEIRYAKAQGFEGKIGEFVYLHEAMKVLVGAGKDEYELAMASAALKLPPGTYQVNQVLSSQAILVWALAQYRFDRYKKKTVLPRGLCLSKALKNQVLKEARALFLVRDLINMPAMDMGPLELARAAKALSLEFGAQFELIEGEALAQGYPAIDTVGRAAVAHPRLIYLEWGKTTHPLVSLVGKGVCFDSGGLDLKNSSGMRLMKKDMGGAAHALGLAQWIMSEKLPIRLQVYIPAVENAIGPHAYRPGDVICMRNQLTVEVENTDAEGRLILADALVKACEAKPDLLIDFSTLTGAARIAVGTDIAALFCNDDILASELLNSSQATHDPIWRLPLFTPYESLLDSSIADMMNSASSSYAGAIVAALFLKRFVNPEVKWAHFDMMAWNLSNKPGRPEGGEAMALRAVMHYLKKQFI